MIHGRDGVYRVGGGVSPPKLICPVEPEYTAEALQAKIEGQVSLLLRINAKGDPQDIEVVRSLDPALDLKAIEAVRQWKFHPAEKDGKPVSVMANAEVGFARPNPLRP
jgi:protein TonB